MPQRLGPLLRQLFEPRAQALAILARLGETIDMIDSHAVDQTFGEEPEDERMRCLEHLGPLDAHAAQRAHVEEAPPVHFIGGGAPPCEPVMLALQQPMQPVAARGRVGRVRGEDRFDRGTAALGLRDGDERGARIGGARLIGGLRRQADEALRKLAALPETRRGNRPGKPETRSSSTR